MMNSFDKFTDELMRFLKGEESATLLIASTVALVVVVAIVRRLLHARIIGRLQSAAAAYAEREMEKQPGRRNPQFETSGARS